MNEQQEERLIKAIEKIAENTEFLKRIDQTIYDINKISRTLSNWDVVGKIINWKPK